MDTHKRIAEYIISLGDNCLILGQGLGKWCGHGPVLEVDMALTNIALDLFGQTRSYFQYAAQIEDEGRSEDDIAFLRDARDFRNALLVEQENGDFAQTIVRQFLFDAWHQLMLSELQSSNDDQLAAIATKSLKEVSYHLRFSSQWMLRLGDGTEESHSRMQNALDQLWQYTGELCEANSLDFEMAELGIGPVLAELRPTYLSTVRNICSEATLRIPEEDWQQSGGKTGMHSEKLGHLLADMQWMQRAYPGSSW